MKETFDSPAEKPKSTWNILSEKQRIDLRRAIFGALALSVASMTSPNSTHARTHASPEAEATYVEKKRQKFCSGGSMRGGRVSNTRSMALNFQIFMPGFSRSRRIT